MLGRFAKGFCGAAVLTAFAATAPASAGFVSSGSYNDGSMAVWSPSGWVDLSSLHMNSSKGGVFDLVQLLSGGIFLHEDFSVEGGGVLVGVRSGQLRENAVEIATSPTDFFPLEPGETPSVGMTPLPVVPSDEVKEPVTAAIQDSVAEELSEPLTGEIDMSDVLANPIPGAVWLFLAGIAGLLFSKRTAAR